MLLLKCNNFIRSKTYRNSRTFRSCSTFRFVRLHSSCCSPDSAHRRWSSAHLCSISVCLAKHRSPSRNLIPIPIRCNCNIGDNLENKHKLSSIDKYISVHKYRTYLKTLRLFVNYASKKEIGKRFQLKAKMCDGGILSVSQLKWRWRVGTDAWMNEQNGVSCN